MSYILAPLPKMQFIDDNGNPLAGGTVSTYAAGTSTPIVTYADFNGTANANPIILDSGGRANIWLDSNTSYKFVIASNLGVTLYTVDNINNAVTSMVTTVAIMSALQALNGSYDGQRIVLSGYNTANDGGGGDFYYSATSGLPADNGMVVMPPNSTGRWLRIAYGAIDVRWYGATGNGVTNDAPAFVAADTFCSEYADALTGAHEWYLVAKSGIYKLSSAWVEKVRIKLEDGAILQTSGTFTIRPMFNQGDFTLHFVTSSGSITLDLNTIYPEWFGAVGDPNFGATGTDYAPQIQSAINAASAGKEVVFNGAKKYFSSSLTLIPGAILRGSQAYENEASATPASEYYANLQYAGASGSVFLVANNGGVGGVRGVTIKGLIIDGNGPVSQADAVIGLATAGSLVERCTIRNGTGGIVFAGTGADSSKNRVIDCTFRNITGSAIKNGAADTYSTDGIISNCIFVNGGKDVDLGTMTGWAITNNKYSASGGPVSGIVLNQSNAGITNYRNTILAGAQGNFSLAERVGSWADTSPSFGSSTNAWDHRFFVRTSGGPTVAGAGIHNGLGLDATPTPRTNSRAWYERWMDGSHHWGDNATELMTLNGTALTLAAGLNIISVAGFWNGFQKGTDLSVISNKITIVRNYHVVTGSDNIYAISTAGCTAGAVIFLTFTGNTKLWHEYTSGGFPGTGFASLFCINGSGGQGDFTVGTQNPTLMFIYDGTYWRNMGLSA